MRTSILLIPLLITTGFAILVKLPIKQFYINLGLGEYAYLANALTKTVVVLGISFLLIKKLGISSFGGFKGHVYRNHWMLILPLIYPGIWTFSKLNMSCLEGAAILTLATRLLHGLVEEVVFRGLIQGYLMKNRADHKSHGIILYTTLLFALGHFLNLTNNHLLSVISQVLYAFFMGLLFSAIQLRVNNVWLLGLVHGILNFLFIGCGTYAPSFEETEPGFWDYVENIVSLTIVFSPTLLIYFGLMKGIKKRNPPRNP